MTNAIINNYFAMFLDLVALPELEKGAMENWGLITYRETAILNNSSETSVATQQWFTSVIVHAMIHQVSDSPIQHARKIF